MVVKLPEPREKIIENLLRLANTRLPADIGWALEAAAGWESNPAAATQLAAIMEIPESPSSTSGAGSTVPS